jgi:hypothetical protein
MMMGFPVRLSRVSLGAFSPIFGPDSSMRAPMGAIRSNRTPICRARTKKPKPRTMTAAKRKSTAKYRMDMMSFL